MFPNGSYRCFFRKQLDNIQHIYIERERGRESIVWNKHPDFCPDLGDCIFFCGLWGGQGRGFWTVVGGLRKVLNTVFTVLEDLGAVFKVLSDEFFNLGLFKVDCC